jgi:hypothetical protein
VGRRPPAQASDDFCTHSEQFASFTVNDDFVPGGGTKSSLTGAADERPRGRHRRLPSLDALATARHNATADDRTTLTRSVESLI